MNAPEPQWTQQDADSYRAALDLLTELIMATDACIEARSDEATTEELRSRRNEYAEERRTLSVLQRTEVRRIVEQYPAQLHQLRTGQYE